MIIAVTLVFIKIITHIIKWIKGVFLLKSLILIINNHENLQKNNMYLHNIQLIIEEKNIQIKCKNLKQKQYIFEEIFKLFKEKYDIKEDKNIILLEEKKSLE
ncbi:hypothetical protein AB836_01075 [Rickettsiales bacterium (ex Bugula neritina AB1)]|nr:hypothetical protein AB836_01075 [Rickettsiales bacterium (ex Bugula neritina AB1)]